MDLKPNSFAWAQGVGVLLGVLEAVRQLGSGMGRQALCIPGGLPWDHLCQQA